MTWTIERLEKLEIAYQSGALECEYEGDKIRYRSLKEMKLIIMEGRDALGQNKVKRRTKVLPVLERGV